MLALSNQVDAFHINSDKKLIAIASSALEGNYWTGEITIKTLSDTETTSQFHNTTCPSVITTAGISSIQWLSPSCIATALDNGNVQVWGYSVDALTPHILLPEHDDIVTVIKRHPTNSAELLSASMDCTFKVWDVLNGVSTSTFEDHFAPVTCISYSLNNLNVVSSGSADTHLRLWDIRDKQKVTSTLKFDFPVSCCEWNPMDENQMVVGCDNGCLSLIDVRKGSLPIVMNVDHRGSVNSIAFHESVIATACNDTVIRILENRSLNTQKSLHIHSDYVREVSWLGKSVVSCSWDKTCKITSLEA